MSAYDIPPAPGLDFDGLLAGYEMLDRVTNWREWVFRRVETCSWDNAQAIRRKTSVDFRLHADYFDKPRFLADGVEIHYVPLMFLRKQRLLAFDLRDETGAAVPLMTRWRNSKLAMAMLSACAQKQMAVRLRELLGDESILPFTIELPDGLQERFWRLAYPLELHGDLLRAEFEDFNAPPVIGRRDVERWQWTVEGARKPAGDRAYVADAGEQMWRWFLSHDEKFTRFAGDISESFLVCVPVPARSELARI